MTPWQVPAKRRQEGETELFTLFGQPLIHTRNFSAREFFCPTICRYIVQNKVTLWSPSYSACVVYTKTIIHLSVGESGGYLPRRFEAR